ncbi:MAG TPA: hypothetical protein VFP38_10055 [Bradyrhizobium sp.]|nr:hypothetical protein [Bradyrhizobium sp.]
MKRREFIAGFAGAAAAWPIGVRAQQGERMRRIGVLIPLAADDPQSQRRMTAFVQGLQELGWTDGRNIRIDTRWTAGDTDRMAATIASEPQTFCGWPCDGVATDLRGRTLGRDHGSRSSRRWRGTG